MTGKPDPSPSKRALLLAAVDHVARNGIRDQSLRQIAAALGTSHRMLIYHFGSRDGLLVEVVRAVEEQQRQALAELEASVDAGRSPADVMRLFWRRLADPALFPHERLFFEIYSRALHGEPDAVPVLDGIVDAWIQPTMVLLGRLGLPAREAEAHARLGVAVARGLLLDLLATGDRAAVDDAMEQFIAMVEASLPPTIPAH